MQILRISVPVVYTICSLLLYVTGKILCIHNCIIGDFHYTEVVIKTKLKNLRTQYTREKQKTKMSPTGTSSRNVAELVETIWWLERSKGELS